MPTQVVKGGLSIWMAGLDHVSQLPKSSQTSSSQSQWASSHLLLSGPRPSTSRNHPRFNTWIHQGISKPSTNSCHLRLLYSSGRVAPGKTQVGADIGLHHPGNPRAWVPSGQLPNMSEYHQPVSVQLIIHGRQRLVVSGHSTSLKETGLGKSLPFICQQQPRLSYKKRVYSAHMKGAPRVPSSGDGGSCATGTYRTPTVLGHTTKTRNQSSST